MKASGCSLVPLGKLVVEFVSVETLLLRGGISVHVADTATGSVYFCSISPGDP
jgi:hypothetical protein